MLNPEAILLNNVHITTPRIARRTGWNPFGIRLAIPKTITIESIDPTKDTIISSNDDIEKNTIPNVTKRTEPSVTPKMEGDGR